MESLRGRHEKVLFQERKVFLESTAVRADGTNRVESRFAAPPVSETSPLPYRGERVRGHIVDLALLRLRG